MARKYIGKREEIEAGALNSMIVEPESIQDQLRKYHGQLTPRSVSGIIRLAEMGRPRGYCDLVYGIRRRDGHIHSCFQTVENGIKSLKYDVIAPETSSQRSAAKSKRAAVELGLALRDSQNFGELKAQMAGDGTMFGRSWSETEWYVTPKGRMWPRRWKPINARRFLFRQSDSHLMFDPVGNGNESDGVDLVEQYGLGKFVEFYPRINGDDLIREGVGHLTCWLGMFRNWGVRDYLQLGESSWRPRRIGYYQKTASREDRIALKNALMQLTRNGSSTLPDTVKIDELWAQPNTKGQHKDLLVWLAKEFSKATLGATDIVEPSEVGAKAATLVRAELRDEMRESLAVGISLALTAFVSVPFTLLNYGPNVAPPLIVILTDDVTDLEAFTNMVRRMREGGLPIPLSYVYDKTGIRPPRNGEETMPIPPDLAVAPEFALSPSSSDSDDENGDDESENSDSDDEGSESTGDDEE